MTNDREGKPAADRRDFLKLATVGAVLGGAAIVAGGKAKAAEPETSDSAGYRETDHVKTYYKLARF
jgi:hypothetical protein